MIIMVIHYFIFIPVAILALHMFGDFCRLERELSYTNLLYLMLFTFYKSHTVLLHQCQTYLKLQLKPRLGIF